MDEIGDVNVSWAKGYAESTIHHIDQDVICYVCGSNIKFVNTANKEEKVFPSPGNGITALAASPIHQVFAVAEACLNPRIFICEYPSMKVINTLKGGTDLEYKVLAFSMADSYLASCSGVPDFVITAWDWKLGESLCKYEMKVDTNIKSLSFNPLNWHLICACGVKRLYVFSLQKCNKVFMIDPKEIHLPEIESKSKDDEIFRPSTKTGDNLHLMLSTKARLVGHAARKFKAPHQFKPSVRPTSHCWTDRGEIYVGCLGGQLFSIESETGNVTEIFDGPIYKPRSGEVIEGMFRSLSYNLQGLYCGGSDGVLRKINMDKNGVKITREYEGTSEIVTQSFSPPSFVELTFATTSGSIAVFNAKIENCRTVIDSHIGQFIGASFSDGGNICVGCRQDGTVELWEAEFGTFVSRISINAEATAFASCPSSAIIAIGTSSGHVYHVDIFEPEKPRVISCQRLHHGPVDHLLYTALGLHLISCNSEERHIFVINAKPSSGFECVGYIDCCGVVKSITSAQHEEDRTHFSVVVFPNAEKMEGEEDGKSEEPSLSDRLVIFSIPNDDTTYTKEQYNTTLKDFKDDFIKRLTFDLILPLDCAIVSEIDANLHVFAMGLENKKLLQFKFPLIQDDSTSIHNPSHEMDGHELSNGMLALSSHSQWILSHSPDGKIILRDLRSPTSCVTVGAHSYLSGGVSSACLSPDGQRFVSTGKGDMCLILYSWNLTARGRIAMNSALEFARNRDMILRSIAEKEELSIKNMKDWEGQEKEDDKTTENTWYDEQLDIAHQQENLKYDADKKDLRKNISELRKTILGMMEENLQRPEVEQLNQEEYNLDVEQQKELQAKEEHRVQEVRDGIELENLAEKFLKYIMQKEFWDDMVVKGLALKAFNTSTNVTNYSMRELVQTEAMVLSRVSRIRAAEIEELHARKEIVEISTGQTTMGEEEEEEDEGAAHPDRQLSLHGSCGPKYGGENPLFYSQFDLHTREEKINQILFLKDAIRRMKLAFNKDFMNAYQNKEQELARAKEKNIRIREIMEDLEVDASKITDLSMGIDEKPEKILTVADEEVAVERVLSLEQQKQLIEEQKQEQARIEAAKKDNKRERGLIDMMGGVLELKKEDILKQDIPLPEFIAEKQETDWTEEEKKIMKELEKKQKDLQEEREKYRKNLENELKKLQQAVAEGMTAFDEQLMQLYNRKVKTEMVIKQEESKILRLSSAILIDDEINTQEQQLNFAVHYARERKSSASNTEAEIRKLVDEFRESYDSFTAEDKLLDRAFKRDFSDVPLALVDPLNKQFKRRPRIHRPAASSDTSHSFNPYSFETRSQQSFGAGARSLPIVDMSEETLAALSELDDYSNAPEGIEEGIWQRLCSSRRTKVESELRVKKHAAALAEMTKYLQHLQDEIEMINSELQDLDKQQNKLAEDRMRNSLNLEIQFLLKQGQVEMESSDFISDYSDSILIHRPVVEDLNSTIRGLGEQKVLAMTECKDFKKGIHQLEWERKRMMMQMDDLHNKARHIQMLKLAKDLQLYLNEENHQVRQAKQMQVLEETLALQDKHLEKNVAEKRAMIRDLERSIRHKELENVSLEKEAEELHVSVSERNNIDEVNAAERAKNTADSRLRGIVQRRKLVDLAKAQAQEVAVLRAEVERLRMKTFPALVQIER